MSIKSHSVHTIVGKDAVKYLETRNDGNPEKRDILERAKAYKFDYPAEHFETVSDQYRPDFACRINTVIYDDGSICSSVTHIYNVLVKKNDGEVFLIQTDKASKRYFLMPVPIETAHGPVTVDTRSEPGKPNMFERANPRKIALWTVFCQMLREKKNEELIAKEKSSRAFFERASNVLGDKIHVLQQTGPNVTKFCFDYGQLRFTYEEQAGKWYRTYQINPLAVPSDEDLFGKAPTWVDLGLPSGHLWAAENEAGYHQYDEAVKTFGDMLPSADAWQELFDQCSRKWDDNRKGYILTGPNGNTIFLPAKGWQHWNEETNELNGGDVYSVGLHGLYWSSSLLDMTDARGICFNDSSVETLYDDNRLLGFSVRLCKAPNN